MLGKMLFINCVWVSGKMYQLKIFDYFVLLEVDTGSWSRGGELVIHTML